MAKPRVFISSTYYDLKHVRASLEVFVETLGYEPILSEYGSITYDPAQPLDESCYREAQSSDILVLIIGGRYGSAASNQTPIQKKRDEEFESVTRREFTRAHDADIPVYVLIESGVYSEYQTYLRNKDNESIKYAHVDSSKVFSFIEFIFGKQRNNPVQSFEKGVDIESWLRDQWAGLFQELLRKRQDQSKFSDLASQIRHLEAINTTLKSYMETVLETVSPDKSSDIIERENKSLSKSQLVEAIRKNDWFDHLVSLGSISQNDALDASLDINSTSDVIPAYSSRIKNLRDLVYCLEPLVEFTEARRAFYALRAMLGQDRIRFTKKSLQEISRFLEDKRKDKAYKENIVSLSSSDDITDDSEE
ncbi:hypothetical protein GGQ88_000967 [Novosphingobium hassiacum]|uniref:DUF4062 domain-containing protein n=1 Tax=Novosphingobium hassiacum TaxID=173676 RepID=A0A7W5ZUG3_9SPHN|nr:DUF4062 domain-containing protein [Novosphingobium hassiacum]MBB3859706.1 hypothetical protein [Novosphingobium hassiacum]